MAFSKTEFGTATPALVLKQSCHPIVQLRLLNEACIILINRKKTITRVELSDAVYLAKAGLTRTESSALVDLVLKEITDAIARGEMVKLSSFGTFIVRNASGEIQKRA
jgi:hypothetical protein